MSQEKAIATGAQRRAPVSAPLEVKLAASQQCLTFPWVLKTTVKLQGCCV